MYPARVVLACLARTACINATATARNMQGIGMAFTLEPALRWLYPAQEARARAFARHAGPCNTHPFMAPLLTGIQLSLEAAAASGALPPSAVTEVRQTLSATLSALGDAFFSGALLPLWAMVCTCMLLAGQTRWAAILCASLWMALTILRFATFVMGLRYGMAVLAFLGQCDLINRARRLKLLNAALAALLLWLAPWAGSVPAPGMRALAIGAPLACAWLAGRHHAPRLPLYTASLALLILMDLLLQGM